ncbi:MAG TPA: hypothetical protein VFF41_03065 [Gallionella sp.]|nr:hypothetical protein [Gallionella sp.]
MNKHGNSPLPVGTITITIEQLADAIAERVGLVIPLSVALWDSGACAAFMVVSMNHFRQYVAALPGFPQAIRLPKTDGKTGQPRWKAREVIEWTDKFQERRVA